MRSIEVNNSGSSDDSEACCRRLMLGQSRRRDALKYRRNELSADLVASGRDRLQCPRQFDSASNQLLTTRVICFKHKAYKFSASHLNQKLCYKPHNFVPIYLPCITLVYVCVPKVDIPFLTTTKMNVECARTGPI